MPVSDGERALALLTRLAQGNEVPSDPKFGRSGYRRWHADEEYGAQWITFDTTLREVSLEDLDLLSRLAGTWGQT